MTEVWVRVTQICAYMQFYDDKPRGKDTERTAGYYCWVLKEQKRRKQEVKKER